MSLMRSWRICRISLKPLRSTVHDRLGIFILALTRLTPRLAMTHAFGPTTWLNVLGVTKKLTMH